jgi:hypothetical protein
VHISIHNSASSWTSAFALGAFHSETYPEYGEGAGELRVEHVYEAVVHFVGVELGYAECAFGAGFILRFRGFCRWWWGLLQCHRSRTWFRGVHVV